MNRVKLEFNSYLQKLNVFVDNRPVSEYSAIKKYTYMPLISWCDKIFDDIFGEINDVYDLDIVTTPIYAQILEKAAEKSGYCRDITKDSFVINYGITDRLGYMSRYFYVMKEIHIGIIEDRKRYCDDLEEMLIEEKRCDYDDGELVCEAYPGVKVVFEKRATVGDELCFVIADINVDDFELLDLYSRYSSKVIIIKIGEYTRFIDRKRNAFIFEVDGDEITNVFFELISEFVMTGIIAKSYKNIKDEGLYETYNDDLENSVIINSIFIFNAPSSLNLGKSAEITVTELPYSTGEHFYEFKSSNRCIEVCGMTVTAVATGQADLEVFIDGIRKLQYDMVINVTNKKLIESIEISPSTQYITVGDSKALAFKIYPEDAENIEDIRVIPNLESLLEVRGTTITARKEGVTGVVVTAGDVSKEFTVDIRPPISDFFLSAYAINMKTGETTTLNFCVEPENCLEAQTIRGKSMDEKIASYRGEHVVANSHGTTKIIFSDATGRIRKECTVIVKKSGLFR